VDDEAALTQARAVDARRRAGQPLGKLAGLPVAVKDVLCTRGQRTSCGSKILANYIPPYDAHVITRLRDADAVLIGKTNMDEFAMGSSTENSAFHVTHNPWDLERIPGGSSGGSAAAVAACEAPLALGTDTGGSIRQPASLCGLVGLKPTYGRVSRFGMIAFASSLDQGGLITRSAEDAALLLGAMAGFDERDSTSVELPVPDYSSALGQPLKGLKIGVLKEFFDKGLEPEIEQHIRAALDLLRSQGAVIRDVSLPNLPLSVPTYYVVAPAECSSNLARFDGVRYGHRCDHPRDLLDLYQRSRGEGFGAEVKRRIMTGTYVLSAGYYDAFYLKAQRVRQLISNDFERAFHEVDVVIGPTTPTTAFELGAKTADPVTMYLNDIYTIGANLAGLPAISLPCGLAQGLPTAMQIIGPHFGEERLLNVAHRYQLETDWHRRSPPGFA
jgi:aspartyl-tRNA(Asn)/glutamyl-tRNA(Gln) amidotransferase subunit A